MSEKRISIGRGKYCYSGPTCRLHGQKQVEAARTRLLTALNTTRNVTTLDEMVAARAELEAAKIAYDATPEGLRMLQDHLTDADESLKLELQVRLNNAKAFAEAYETQEKQKFAGKKPTLGKLNTLTDVGSLNENYTYDVPTYETVNPETDMYAPTVGSKYTGWQSVKNIATKLRGDLKEATEKGYLPSGLRYAVTTDKYSGGQSIRVSIQNTKDSEMWVADPNFPDSVTHSSLNAQLTERVKKLTDAYNSQAIYGQVDYFNSLYYSSVEVESEKGKARRVMEAEFAARKRAEKPIRDNLNNLYRATPSKINEHVSYTHETKVGNSIVQVGQVKDSSVYIAKQTNTLTGLVKFEAYDFSQKAIPADPSSVSAQIATIFESGRRAVLNKQNFLKR